MKNILMAFGLFLMAFGAISQEIREYDIKVIGIKVGSLKATRLTENNQITYALKSTLKVNFLVYSLKVDYDVKSVFENNILQSSIVKAVSNKGDFESTTIRKDSTYHIISIQPDKTVNKTIDKAITSSFAKLFFVEPIGETESYAEFFADFLKLTKDPENYYLTELEKNFDELHYENGLLKKLVKRNPITNLVLEIH